MTAKTRTRGRPRTIDGVPAAHQITGMTIKDPVARKPLTATFTITDVPFGDGQIDLPELPPQMKLIFYVSQGVRLIRATPPVQLLVSMAKSFNFEVVISSEACGSLETFYQTVCGLNTVLDQSPFLIYGMTPHSMSVMQNVPSMIFIIHEALSTDGKLMAVMLNPDSHRRLVKQPSGFKVNAELGEVLLHWYQDGPVDIPDGQEIGPVELLQERLKAKE
jgi:hypothetical protein